MPFFPDWKYFDLVAPGRHARRDRVLNISSECLREVVQAFLVNVARMDSFIFFPAEVAMQALGNQIIRDHAIFKITGKITIRNRQFDKETLRAINKEIVKQRGIQKRKFNSGKESREQRRLSSGVGYINQLLGTSYGANQSIEALLFSVIVESWVAFETLAADLWFTALDYGPPEWRARTLSKAHKFRKRKESDGDSPPSIPVEDADPQKRFAASLRKNDLVSFQKFWYIKFWYKVAFGSEAAEIFKLNRNISVLAAVRNVIIHNSGIADKQYIGVVKGFSDLGLSGEIGKPIHLNGELVRELRNVAIHLGSELVLFIDRGIASAAATSL